MSILTPRQRELADLIAVEGLTTKELATRLGMSVHTVRSHLYGTTAADGILARIGGRSMKDVVKWWYTIGQEGP